MSKKENLFKVFAGEDTGITPVGFWFHFLQEEQLRNGAAAEPSLLEGNKAGHKAFIEAFKPDVVKIMTDGYFQYPSDPDAVYNTAADLSKITLIDAAHPWVTAQAELARYVAALQADTAYFYNVFSPLNQLVWIVGREKAEAFIANHPAAVETALAVIAEGLLVLTKAVVGPGAADGIYFSASTPDEGWLSDETYEKLIAPGEIAFLEKARAVSANNILHVCGYAGKRNTLTLYRDYPVAAVNWAAVVEGVSLSEGAKIFAGKALIGGFGNTKTDLLYTGSREAIEAETKKLLAESGKKGVVLGADCTVPADIALERLDWVRAAVK